MEEKNVKLEGSKSGSIIAKWIAITIIIYMPFAFIIDNLVNSFTKSNFYGVYYEILCGDFLYMPGFSFILIGFIVDELIYFYKCKNYKNVIPLIIVLFFIFGITYKFMPYSEIYEFCKDLNYVSESTYCEDIQDLKNVYINVTTGKISTKSLYIETSDFKFHVNSNIVEKDDYDIFKAKYGKVKKVKIKYLPNSKILLSIQPVED